jgi:putative flavoprotein involved in K+ transport
MHADSTTEIVDTVVIGAGQAGLATGYYLARQGREFTILDGAERIGDSWRSRWDSLRLFTPAKYNRLPGTRFPARRWSFPTKDEMADYLESYAARFDLPVETGVKVERVSRRGDRFIVAAGDRRIEAANLVVASGAHRIARVPGFALDLDPRIVQLHSSDYRSPSQLRNGGTLVVGAGNSGAEIAKELVATQATWLSGGNVGEIPVPHGGMRARIVLPIIRFLGHHVLTVRTPIGRKVGPTVASGATPLIRTKSADLEAAGVERLPRVTGVREGLPELEDGRVLDVANVVWCTGFHDDYSWLELPAFGDDGRPAHDRGVVASQPGLYFVGLVFQYSATSDVLPGVGRDAKRIAGQIARRSLAPRRAAAPLDAAEAQAA